MSSEQPMSSLEKLEQVDPEFSKAFKEISGEEATRALDPKARSLISLATH